MFGKRTNFALLSEVETFMRDGGEVKIGLAGEEKSKWKGDGRVIEELNKG